MRVVPKSIPSLTMLTFYLVSGAAQLIRKHAQVMHVRILIRLISECSASL